MLNLAQIESNLMNSKTGKLRSSPPKDPAARMIFNILKGGIGSYILAKPEELEAAKALGVKLGVYSPRTRRSGMDVFLEGDTVKYQWYGMPGSGSLFSLMLPGNADAVNSLSLEECLAVYLCIKRAPYASERRLAYQTILLGVKDGSVFKGGKIPEMKLGDLRMILLKRAGDGINAPADTYLKLASDIKKGM